MYKSDFTDTADVPSVCDTDLTLSPAVSAGHENPFVAPVLHRGVDAVQECSSSSTSNRTDLRLKELSRVTPLIAPVND